MATSHCGVYLQRMRLLQVVSEYHDTYEQTFLPVPAPGKDESGLDLDGLLLSGPSAELLELDPDHAIGSCLGFQ